MKRVKSLTTKKYIDGIKNHNWPPFNKRLWQRNYHGHIIRNDKSLNNTRNYIINNPAAWQFDIENPDRIDNMDLETINIYPGNLADVNALLIFVLDANKKGGKMKLLGRIIILSSVIMVFVSDVSFAKEREIPLSKVPQEVIDTVNNELPGIKLIEAEIITRGGKKIYEIEGRFEGKEYEFQISPEGKVIKAGHEKEISLSKVPGIVIDAANKKIKGIKLTEAEVVTKFTGEIFYKIEGKRDNKIYELQITSEGKVIESTPGNGDDKDND